MAWAESIYVLLVLRFIGGVGGQGYYQISFILGISKKTNNNLYKIICFLKHIKHFLKQIKNCNFLKESGHTNYLKMLERQVQQSFI